MMAHDFINVFCSSNDADNFGAMLFRLIRKADSENRHRLKRSFEKEVLLFEWWLSTPEIASHDKIFEMAHIIEDTLDQSRR